MECKSSALCIFDEQDVQTDIIGNMVTDYYPLTSVQSGGPIEFFVPGTVDEYIDLSDLQILLNLKITKKGGGKIAAGEKVCFVNQPLSSIFQDVFLTIGDTQVEGGQHSYPYNGYLSSLLQFHPTAKKTHMQAWGWYEDDAGKFDDDETNEGAKNRAAETSGSGIWEVQGPLFLDMTRQTRYILPQVDIRLKLLLASPAFALHAYTTPTVAVPSDKISTDYLYKVTKCVLYVRRVRVNDSVLSAHSKGLEKTNAKYLLQHVDISSYVLNSGITSHVKDHLFPSQMPKMLVVGLLSHDAYNGSMTKNPFNFKNYDLQKIGLYRDGELVPGQVFELSFSKDSFRTVYMHTMRTLNFFNSDDSNGLTLHGFENGNSLYAFDLTPDANCHAKYRSVSRNSSLRLELRFEKALPETVNVLLFAIFDSKLEITKLRDIILSYNR